jgi:hypothetical protein
MMATARQVNKVDRVPRTSLRKLRRLDGVRKTGIRFQVRGRLSPENGF